MAVNLENIIGNVLKKMRLKRFPDRGGIKKCAEMFGVHTQQWRDWESGKRKPSEEYREKLAVFFDIPVAEIQDKPIKKAPDAESEGKAGMAASATADISFQERVAMDIKKALQNCQSMGIAPLVIYIFHAEYRVVYKITELGDTSAILSTSFPISREVADEVLKGQTDPNWTNPDTGEPERLTQTINYSDITYIDFKG